MAAGMPLRPRKRAQKAFPPIALLGPSGSCNCILGVLAGRGGLQRRRGQRHQHRQLSRDSNVRRASSTGP
jgi:hypothetical protein